MNNKFKKLVALIGTKNLIAISALVVLVAIIGIGFAVKNNQKTGGGEDVPKDESVGLQVQENADDVEGDIIDFSEYDSEDDKNNDTSSKDSGSKVEDDAQGDGADLDETVSDDSKENPKDDSKENPKDQSKEEPPVNNNNNVNGLEEDKEDPDKGGFGHLF